MTRQNDAAQSRDAAHWGKEIERAKQRFRTFWDNGNATVDAYRLQKADGNDALNKDKFNILYSSTETMRPNLYAQQPKVRVELRSKDTASDTSRAAAHLLEGSVEYLKSEEDFDELMDAAVEDYMLPGLGQGWVRYEANFEGEAPNQTLLDEMVKIEYVYWQDFLVGVARTWKEVPWVARRLWLNKGEATVRFGAAKAALLKYATRESTGRDSDNPSETAEAWEIWDRTTKTVYWYAEGCADLLDQKKDPLKLKKFFPCPRPLRAIANTRTFVPRALYSQYKAQAETLNVMTKRIRLLSEALRVVGLYDGSQSKLGDVLNPQAGNRMIPVDGWAAFAQAGGLIGSVQWVPIDQVVKVLNELLKAREVCKQEIYEITGFSDIIRGVSKASETLGAQNIKSSWAGARVKKMQNEVQRFARDLLALAGELVAEHCEPATIAMFSGVEIPTPEQITNNPQMQERLKLFKDACGMIKSEMRRVSVIKIETDSTLLADDQQERTDRSQFLAAAGAFLQQAVPAMEATPELGPLLGDLLMFTVRTFPSSRSIEESFESVQKAMASRAQQPQEQDKDGKKAKAQADAQKAQADAAQAAQELESRHALETQKAQLDATAETNRHMEKMAELELKSREVGVREAEIDFKRRELVIAEQDSRTRKFAAMHAAAIAELGHEAEVEANEREEILEYNAMDREDSHRDADREAQTQAAEAAAEAKEADSEPGGEEDA
jgi:hypothetical protein